MGFINLLFSVGGRINRGKWWLAVVFWTAIWFVVIIASIISFASSLSEMSSDMSSEDAWKIFLNLGLFGILFFIVIVIPMIVSGIFVGIKRLHDRDKSGWWLALFYLGPMVLQAIGEGMGSGVGFVFAIAGFGIAIWGLVELGFLRGTPGPNQYGPDPLASQQTVPQAA
jgi:uncharacterized membrane protein YhaH (DUF805 family)